MASGQRQVLALTLRTTADVVAAVVAKEDDSSSALVAVAGAKTLASVVEDVMRTLVHEARAEGVTWQEIGTVLGTTRQAAFQRFGRNSDDPGLEGRPMNKTFDAATKAREVFERYRDRDWSIVEEFDETMAERLPVALLDAGWTQLQGAFGACTAIGEPVARETQGMTAVDVPMHFERAEMKGRVAFDARGLIAGLFVLDPKVP